MGWESIPGITANVDRLGSALDDVTARARAAGAALKIVSDFGSPFESAGTSAGGTGAGFSSMVGIPGLSWGESPFTPQQKSALFGGGNPNADSAAVAAAFKALADRIDKFEGNTNNYWSQLLTKELPYITTGATSAASAEGMISTILKVFLPGMEQELQN